MAEMINEPRILDLATKELDEVVGKNRLVQESDLPRLNYIKACVKKSTKVASRGTVQPPTYGVSRHGCGRPLHPERKPCFIESARARA